MLLDKTFHLSLTISRPALASNAPELELEDVIRTFQREVRTWVGKARAAELVS